MQKGLIGVFPEGRRNSTSTLLPGKTGAVRLALAAHCPIVPVGIRLPATGGRFFFSWLLGLNRPAFVFGSPISFNAENERPVTKTQLVEHTNDIMRAIDRLSGKSFTERS
jgi:1-acyl-sn-glycerol-3-phosphate acyltransferase